MPTELDQARERIALLEETLWEVTKFMAHQRSNSEVGWWNDAALASRVRQVEQTLGRRLPD